MSEAAVEKSLIPEDPEDLKLKIGGLVTGAVASSRAWKAKIGVSIKRAATKSDCTVPPLIGTAAAKRPS